MDKLINKKGIFSRNYTMEDKYINFSEDFSLFSDAEESSSNFKTSLNFTSPDHDVAVNEHRNTFPKDLQNLKKFSQIFKKSLRKNTNLQENKELQSVNIRQVQKGLKISGEKLNLIDTQPKRKSNINLLTSKGEHQTTTDKNQENNLQKIPLTNELDTKKYSSKDIPVEIVEIEVFMPVIDSQNNKILYPVPNKPVIKRYFANRKPKIHELSSKIKYIDKNDREITEKKLSENSIKRQKKISNKNVNKPERKTNVSNTVKNVPPERKSSAIDLKIQKALDLENKKAVAQFGDYFKVNYVNNNEKSVSGKRDKHKRNVPISGYSEVPSKNLSGNEISSCGIEYTKSFNPMITSVDSNLPTKRIISDVVFTKTSSTLNGTKLPKENRSMSMQKRSVFRSSTNKSPSRQKTESIPFKSFKAKLNSNNKRLNRERNAATKKSSNLSVTKKLIKNKLDEHGRKNAVDVKRNNSLNDWRKELETEDGLNIESWLDRSKYLQAKETFFRKPLSSRWRSN